METKANFAGADAAEVAQADKTKGNAMSERERMMKLLAANPATLAKVDAVLNGTDGKPDKVDDDLRLITLVEAARMMNLSRPTVYRLVRAGRLDVVPLDGVNRIRLKSVKDYINNPPEIDTEAQQRKIENCRRAGIKGQAAAIEARKRRAASGVQ